MSPTNLKPTGGPRGQKRAQCPVRGGLGPDSGVRCSECSQTGSFSRDFGQRGSDPLRFGGRQLNSVCGQATCTLQGHVALCPTLEPVAVPPTPSLLGGIAAPQPRQRADSEWGPSPSIGGTDAVPSEDASASCYFIRDPLEEPRTLLVLQGPPRPRPPATHASHTLHTQLCSWATDARWAPAGSPAHLSPGPRVQGSHSGTPAACSSLSSSVSTSSYGRGLCPTTHPVPPSSRPSAPHKCFPAVTEGRAVRRSLWPCVQSRRRTRVGGRVEAPPGSPPWRAGSRRVCRPGPRAGRRSNRCSVSLPPHPGRAGPNHRLAQRKPGLLVQ